MGRQNGESPVMHSSAELLQERFRKLQRVKQMREEMEQIRAAAAIATAAAAAVRSPIAVDKQQPSRKPKGFVHSELIRPSRPLSRPSFSLTGAEPHADSPAFPRPWPTVQGFSNVGADEGEVDTSLHL
ncbi:hypothetical protein AXF42_Ash009110 [Apostasia shenzhenica]|uniref:Uncharacterized protein n=1 Tax=Apostasia shenzhenica TaxID=1088818 RepID=A0A2I0ADJ4_9ASPA|nr:hypothetical protein AXF42_Ash009110 [Apostasia shenzhenica]